MVLAAAVAPPLPPSPRSKSSRDCPPQLSPKSILLLLMNLMTKERQQQNNQSISLDERIVRKECVPPLTLSIVMILMIVQMLLFAYDILF